MTTTQQRFTQALVRLAEQRRRPPCGDHDRSHLWLSEDASERAVAARLCLACPVAQLCREAAEVEPRVTFGVYGGHDYSRPSDRRSSDA